MLEPKIPVAKEGVPFIFVASLLTLVCAALHCVTGTVLFLAATIFILAFFRDPERFIPTGENLVVSPADGRIIIIDEVEESRFIKQKMKKISIFMNVFNVHTNRIPLAGRVEEIIHKPGKFYNADSTDAELQNEACGIIMESKSGKRYAFVQIAGLIARRIVCRLEAGDTVKTGERMGLIRFGSRVDLYLPCEAQLSVAMGDTVVAGETVLARFPQS